MSCGSSCSNPPIHPERSSFTTSNGLSLSYIYQADTGCSRKQSVILLHGVASNANYWLCLMRCLAPRFNVYALDLPNSGSSQSTTPQNLTLPSLTFYLADFVNHLGLTNAYFVGHGIGGLMALNYSILFPDRVIRIVTASVNPRSLPAPPPSAPWDYPIEPQLLILLAQALAPGADINALAPVIARAVDPINCPAVSDLVPQYARSVEQYRVYTAALSTIDFRTFASAVPVPVLVTAGSLDPYTPLGAAQFMYDNIPDSTFSEFAEQGYNYPIFATSTFNQVVYNYLTLTCDPCCAYLLSVQNASACPGSSTCSTTSAYQRYIDQISSLPSHR